MDGMLREIQKGREIESEKSHVGGSESREADNIDRAEESRIH
jgi:hypothetical protein